jgi:hypothetical protein
MSYRLETGAPALEIGEGGQKHLNPASRGLFALVLRFSPDLETVRPDVSLCNLLLNRSKVHDKNCPGFYSAGGGGIPPEYYENRGLNGGSGCLLPLTPKNRN